MAKVANVEVLPEQIKSGKASEEIKPAEKKRKQVRAKKGVVRFVNLTDSDIVIVAHVIPANGFREFLSSIGNAMCKVPIIKNLERLDKIKIVRSKT